MPHRLAAPSLVDVLCDSPVPRTLSERAEQLVHRIEGVRIRKQGEGPYPQVSSRRPPGASGWPKAELGGGSCGVAGWVSLSQRHADDIRGFPRARLPDPHQPAQVPTPPRFL